MNNLFLALLLLAIVAFFIGLVSPSTLKLKTRKSATLITGGAILTFFILFGITTPSTPKEQVPEVAKVAPVTQPTASAVVTEQVKSDTVVKKLNTTTITPNTNTPTPPTKTEPQKTSVPTEYKSALNTAGSYANKMHMSKRKLYDQLTSEYGEKFTAEAAQYAIDNVKADWNANALATAKNYQNTMNMSPAKIHDQLTSEYGEKFTQAEADYAIQHLND
ncbi:TPA: hypothetical protein DEP94_03990 [Candidatus Nomurabacteria bacterium]|nr:hypothetical protein [Candidatus Nomurabacteria bacterium]